MTKNSGPIRKPGRPKKAVYDLQLLLQVDVGRALAGKSVNAFIDAAASDRTRPTGLKAATVKRRYYKLRTLMAPIIRPDGRLEESPSAKGYAKLLAEVRATFGAA